ncbi:MAG: Precorrin-6B methylase 2 [Eubacterium sp.]|nr:Precorrin-6B methylase 2 [Eubacterium sp.]MCR5292215.1 Precorrin-6B methylase 2 [Eubacterium sp.]
MAEKRTAYNNKEMLQWTAHFSDLMNTSPEKIKLINICGKQKNVVPTIETHKRVMIFADSTHDNLFYELWEKGLGEYDVWFAEGLIPNENIKQGKLIDFVNKKLSVPSVIFIKNENTRESYRIGMKNEFFSKGTVKYVGNEIRAVIMSMLNVDSHDVIAIVSGESIVIESAFIASEGTIIAVEPDEQDKRSMEENVSKFGMYNVKIIPDLTPESLAEVPVPRLSFIVATKYLERDIERLLTKNPKMQFVIYTLELDILSGIKDIFERHNIKNMEVTQITVSKTDKNSVFVSQPSPWLITGEI